MTSEIEAIVDRIKAKIEKAEPVDKEREAELREAELLSFMRGFRVPPRALKVLSAYTRTTPVKLVEKWHACQPMPWCLVLASEPGTGKTVAAARHLRMCAEKYPRHWSPRRCWYSASEVMRMNMYDDLEFSAVAAVPYLVLDDLGADYADAKGYLAARIDGIVDQRYREHRVTLITTNLNRRDFRERYGDRVMRRILDGGLYKEFRAEVLSRADR